MPPRNNIIPAIAKRKSTKKIHISPQELKERTRRVLSKEHGISPETISKLREKANVTQLPPKEKGKIVNSIVFDQFEKRGIKLTVENIEEEITNTLFYGSGFLPTRGGSVSASVRKRFTQWLNDGTLAQRRHEAYTGKELAEKTARLVATSKKRR